MSRMEEPHSLSEEAEWDPLKKLMVTCIDDVDSYGSFATFGTFENYVNPGIVVHEVGSIGLPLSSNDAQSLIRACQNSPLEKENQTLIDETVRKIWEIDGSEISFLNEAWNGWLEGVIRKAADSLGVAGGPRSVRAELYKMLLYEQDAMFKPHNDTEKSSGMFGTLVICLPAEHVGGAMRLRYEQEEVILETAESSAFNITYLAWYTDVSHEIRPVKSGHRWMLTYNLINTSVATPQSAATRSALCDRFCEPLAKWRSLDEPPELLCYPFEYRYTSERLTLGKLRGKDHHRARYVADACRKAGDFFFLLGTMKKVVSWTRFARHEDDKESELSLCIMDEEGLDFTEKCCPESYLVDGDFYDNRDPDTEDVEESCAWQGLDMTHTYNDSVLIIGPKASVVGFLLEPECSPNEFAAFLSSLVKGFRQRQSQQCHELIVQSCQNCLARTYSDAEINDSFMAQIAIAALAIANQNLLSVAVHSTINGFDAQDFFNIGQSISFQGSMIGEESLVEAFSRIPVLHRVHQDLQRFRAGFSASDMQRTEKDMSRLENWIELRTSQSLLCLSEVHQEDGAALIEVTKEYGERILEESVKPFISRFLDNSKFVNALAIEMLRFSASSPGQKELVTALWPAFLDTAISKFELTEYCFAPETKSPHDYPCLSWNHRGSPERSRQNSSNVVRLHQQLVQVDEKKASELLRQISLQSKTLTTEEQDLFVIPLLEQMNDILTKCPFHGRQFFVSMITTYMQQVVRQEPKKPSDWAHLDEEIYCCRKDCSHCQSLQEFFHSPDVKSRIFVMNDDSKHIVNKVPWQFKKSIDIDRLQRPSVLTITKTLESWESDHARWQERAEKAQKTLKCLPQEDLIQSLGREEYDALMDLRPIKIPRETTTTDANVSQEKSSQMDDSIKVANPLKRPRSDDES